VGTNGRVRNSSQKKREKRLPDRVEEGGAGRRGLDHRDSWSRCIDLSGSVAPSAKCRESKRPLQERLAE